MKDDKARMDPRNQLYGNYVQAKVKVSKNLRDSLVDNILQDSYWSKIAWMHQNTIRIEK